MLSQEENLNTDRHHFSNFCQFKMFLLLQDKMKLNSLILLIILSISNCIEFNPELQKNILNFRYGINYKYKGMLMHSFDRFYIITKFILPSIGDIRFSHLTFDDSCSYMNKEYMPNMDSSKYLKEFKMHCNKAKTIHFILLQINQIIQ